MSEYLALLHFGSLLCLLTVATYTDLRWRRIYNATTYGGIVSGLALAALNGWLEASEAAPVLLDSLMGLLACGGAMVICYVCFPSGIGGGDVKLIAVIGAFLGVYPGLEAMLWSLLLGAAVALLQLVWTIGAVELAKRSVRGVVGALAGGGFALVGQHEQPTVVTSVYLAPCALAAVLIVQLGLLSY